MRSVRRLISTRLGGRLRAVLIASFALVAALTVGLNALVVSQVIRNYLAEAEDERVARDMALAEAFYQLKLAEVAALGQRIARDPQVVEYQPAARLGSTEALNRVDEVINRKIAVPSVGGTYLVLVLDPAGNILTGRALAATGELSPPLSGGNWASLPILAQALTSGQEQAATEIIPAELLAQVGLDRQAHLPLIDTPLAAPQPLDPREGTAGLALTGVYPLHDGLEHIAGAVLSAHLFNNDFTLVDSIKAAAKVDTATIFLGDLRVSTNVMTEANERAVGTRIAENVREVVLEQGRDYVGRAYVVNAWYITRYAPLRDHRGQIVGSLYVGAREANFQALVQAFTSRVGLIALVSIVLAGIVAVPIARVITRPITALVAANRRLAKGDMTVRVETGGRGELGLLGQSFNTMAAALHSAQLELLHKERLASMGQLAAGVAHEINNPLGTILLLADVVRQETPAGSPIHADLQMIIAEAARCKNIVAALLNFARQQEVLAADTEVPALLEQAIEAVARQPAFAQIQIVRRFDPALPPIRCDPHQLKQVFINLLNNAADAIGGAGTITLAARPVDSQQVEIAVSDTGCGIPEEDLKRLFTPFFSTKPPGRGTGLGLSIVYGIVKMHRGQITAASTPGQGSTFTVTLPVRLPEGQLSPNGARAEVIG